MDIELLKTFLEVRRTRHFGKAADNLHLTQAAVSARIRQLEDLLGVKLFLRSRNNIQLTSEGERLVPHAQTVLLSWTRARQELALETGQISQVHIGVRSGLWSGVLQDRLHKLHVDMPEVVLRTEGHMTDAAVKMLLDRTLDIAMSFDPPSLPEFKTREVGHVTLRLYSRDRKATVESAMAKDYVYMDWGNAFGRFHAKRFGDAVLPVLRTNISESARGFVAGSGGAAYLLSSAAEASRPTLYPVADAPEYRRSLCAAYRGNSDKLTLIEAVLDVFDGVEL
ncbi:MAG: LysR family transcriptional regulator [Halieaceae bacterium]|jgi:DNA-binding transcriptional LysR family regulator|nr:LysR family transcriptional regulator [Halieaceae bacterium]